MYTQFYLIYFRRFCLLFLQKRNELKYEKIKVEKIVNKLREFHRV